MAPLQHLHKTLWTILLPLSPWTLYVLLTNKTILLSWTLTLLNSSDINIIILNDPKSTLFSWTIIFISANISLFSQTYLMSDMFIPRFSYLLALFILSINLLIYLPHLMALLLGWDGLGIISFLLVAYYQNPKSLGASMITALSNRIGDVMILLTIACCLNQGHWFIMNMSQTPLTPLMATMLTLAGMTKSAQIPFSSWLPAAMAAPTPVSALVHSSTLVTAGIFLLIRFHPLLNTFKLYKFLLLLTACLTSVTAGLSAIMETDLKKIIALSTLSQLGTMMATLAMGLPLLALFHLLTHASFKALMFICAGTMIHLFHHTQDLRQMSSSAQQLPLTTSCLLLASSALCGIPFLAGFYSKDLLLETALIYPQNTFLLLLTIGTTALTAAYTTRLLATTWSPPNSPPLHTTTNSSTALTSPAILLSFSAIASGATTNWILILPLQEPLLTHTMKITTPLTIFTGIILMTLNLRASTPPPFLNSTVNMWHLTPLSSQKILHLPLHLSHLTLLTNDHGWTELTSGGGTLSFSSYLFNFLQSAQHNPLTTHILTTTLLLLLLSLLL